MLNVCRGGWRCGRGSIAEAVAEAVNNFLSTTKEKRTKLKWTTMNMLIPTKCCNLLLIHIREMYGNLSSITRGVSAAAGEQWQRALHLLKECIEGKDCLSVATQQHTYGKGRECTGTSEQASQGHN